MLDIAKGGGAATLPQVGDKAVKRGAVGQGGMSYHGAGEGAHHVVVHLARQSAAQLRSVFKPLPFPKCCPRTAAG